MSNRPILSKNIRNLDQTPSKKCPIGPHKNTKSYHLTEQSKTLYLIVLNCSNMFMNYRIRSPRVKIFYKFQAIKCQFSAAPHINVHNGNGKGQNFGVSWDFTHNKLLYNLDKQIINK